MPPIPPSPSTARPLPRLFMSTTRTIASTTRTAPPRSSSNSSSTPSSSPSFPFPPPPLPTTPRQRWNAGALAYLGDSVWELFLRSELMHPPRPAGSIQRYVQRYVNAEAQAAIVEAWRQEVSTTEEPPESESRNASTTTTGATLTAKELDIVRWGSNADVSPPRKVSAKTYRAATGLECLLGYLYLVDHARLQEVLRRTMTDHIHLHFHREEMEEEKGERRNDDE